jgi:hypothetical protein
MKNTSIIGKRLNVFHNKNDRLTKVGSMVLTESSLSSPTAYIKSIQDAIQSKVSGYYSVHMDNKLFSMFDIDADKNTNMHRRSLNTGALMPCWEYIREI